MMTPKRLAEIEARHRDDGDIAGKCVECSVPPYYVDYPCDAAELVVEVRHFRSRPYFETLADNGGRLLR